MPALAVARTLLAASLLAIQEPPFSELARWTDSAVAAVGHRPIALSVAVTKNGRILWEQGFGWADRGRGRRASPHTVYPLASVSKSITAVAVMRLVESGRIGLDEPVASWLAPIALPLPPGADPNRLTVRALLSMTGGIPHLVRFSYADQEPGPLGAEELVKRYGFAAFPPGELFWYSNLSFGILELLLSRVTGKAYAEVLESEIWLPLGLRHSAVRMTPELAADRAQSFISPADPPVPVEVLEPEGGAGLYGSAHDLAILGGALVERGDGRRILRRKTVDTMLAIPPEHVYALGWWTGLTRAPVPVRLADGAAVGTASTLALVPDSGLAVAAIANTGTAADLVHQVIDRVVATLVPPNANAPPIEPPPALAESPFRSTAAWQGRWAGTIAALGRRTPVRLDIADSGVVVTVGDGVPARLENLSLTGLRILTATSKARLPVELVEGVEHDLAFTLALQSGGIGGYATARSVAGRPRLMLPFFLFLARQSDRPGRS